ncbi:phenylacetate--CoA ligase family protein [Thermodesulfobacteriota bacterium]
MDPLIKHIGDHFVTIGALPFHSSSTRERIAAFQTRKLRRIIRHAYNHVTYYRRLFDFAGLKPEDIRSTDDLTLLPVTSCKDFREHPPQHTLTSGLSPKNLVCHSTSGSTSSPFTIYRTPVEEHLINMFRIRAMKYLGVKVSDRLGQLKIMGLSGNKMNLLRSLRRGLRIYKDYLVDCFQPREKILEELRELKPDVLVGYPSFITHVSPFPEEIKFASIRPRLVITGGESLTPFSRKRLIDGFKAEIYDTYGANEFNLLAWECKETGFYHVCDDNIILEVLDNGKPVAAGGRGEVVATSLHAYAMPFIRYNLEDVATKGPEVCPCGLPFSTLRSIQGRIHDYFILPGGPIHPNEITIPIVMNSGSWIDRYRIIQESEKKVKLYIKPLREAREDELEFIRNVALKKLGDRIDFRIEIVEELPFDPSGKFRISRSMVRSHLDGIEWKSI